MLTSLTVRNFKRFEHVSIELGNPVVLIGPNSPTAYSKERKYHSWPPILDLPGA